MYRVLVEVNVKLLRQPHGRQRAIRRIPGAMGRRREPGDQTPDYSECQSLPTLGDQERLDWFTVCVFFATGFRACV